MVMSLFPYGFSPVYLKIRMFLLTIRNFLMWFLFRKPVDEIFRWPFVFCNFINSASEILKQISKTCVRFQQFKTSYAMMKSNPWRMTQVTTRGFKIVIVTHYPGSMFVMTKAFMPESLCSSLATVFSSPHMRAQCPISAALTEHNWFGCNSAELDYSSKHFSLQCLLSHQPTAQNESVNFHTYHMVLQSAKYSGLLGQNGRIHPFVMHSLRCQKFPALS